MKKLMTFVLSAVFVVSLLTPKNARAGMFFPAVLPVATIGAYALFGTGITGAALEMTGERKLSKILLGFAGKIAWPVIGILVLDGEENQGIYFAEITKEESETRGITSSERESYNSQIDELNLILDEVSSKLAAVKEPTLEASKDFWAEYAVYIHADTKSAINKLSR